MATVNLRYVVPELDADATCSCCKKHLSSRYYCNDDGLILFCLDCLFSLPAKRRTKLHKHELLRAFSFFELCCKACDAGIDKGTIFYYCKTCNTSFDMYCLLLPETVDFDRHRHPFKLSIVPRVDSLPYYCEVCQNERNTECWIYYCEECDYPIHPRCIVEAPSLLRSLSTQLLISNQKSEEVLTDKEIQGSSSHLSSEKVMLKELPRQYRSEAKELLKEIETPVLITTKGSSETGRTLVALTLATALDCLLIDEDNMCKVTNIANEPKQVCYQEFSRIALSQLQIGLSVVFDSDLLDESKLFFLRDLAIATETPLFIVECKRCDADNLEDLHKITNLGSEYEFGVSDTPKLSVNVTTPTFDGIKEFIPEIFQSISSYSKRWRESHSKGPENCYRHNIRLVLDNDVSEGEICNRCSKQLLAPILKCHNCPLVLHKKCTQLPLRICVKYWNFILENNEDNNNKVRCDCCGEFVKDHAYTLSDSDIMICLECLFTPLKPRVNLHEHPIELTLLKQSFHCDACGSFCKQLFRYRCTSKNCSFEIGVMCGLLEETVSFDRHRHPFDLIVSPEHVSNQYYCEVCGEERDKKDWVYCCVGCEYFIHIHCLVPTGGCSNVKRLH